MPTARNLMPTVESNGIIYAIGGILGGLSSTSVVEAYDTSTGSWTAKTPLPIPLGSSSGSAFNNKIYVFGGSINGAYGTIVDSVYEYTPYLDTWSKKSNLPKPLSGTIAQTVNGKIYVIGGTTEGFNLAYNSVYEYDPVLDTWDTTKTPMPTARHNHSSAVVGGKIYVFGGATNNTLLAINSVEVYDPVSDTWDAAETPMPIAKCLHTSCASNGKIYIFSGGSGFSTLYNTVEEYDPVLNTWTTKTSIPTARWGLGSCAIGENFYVIGGASVNNQRLATVEVYNPALDPLTSVEVDVRLLDKFTLDQNYPNPFNPTTTIKYSIPKLSFVTIKIYDVLGSEVATLVNEEKTVGTYELTWNAENFTSGVYFYRLKAQDFVEVKKMILLR
jgi:N-acetylneuraminic acid mutarotase